MNLVFNIARTYEHEFTSNNLIKSDMVIDRISMKGEAAGTCLVLDRVNNMQERRQSPLAVLNEGGGSGASPHVHGECAHERRGSQKSQMIILVDR